MLLCSVQDIVNVLGLNGGRTNVLPRYTFFISVSHHQVVGQVSHHRRLSLLELSRGFVVINVELE